MIQISLNAISLLKYQQIHLALMIFSDTSSSAKHTIVIFANCLLQRHICFATAIVCFMKHGATVCLSALPALKSVHPMGMLVLFLTATLLVPCRGAPQYSYQRYALRYAHHIP